MKFLLALLLTAIIPVAGHSQTSHYATVPHAPENYSAGSIAARAIDGLGFRFHWASDGLREEDLNYKPSQDGRTCQQTVEHIYEMSFMIVNATTHKINVNGQDVKLPFDEMRTKTLQNFKAASDALRKATDKEMMDFKVLYSDGKKTYEFPFWNLLNGPIEDCVWHAGQIVSFRRASGNPIKEKDFFG